MTRSRALLAALALALPGAARAQTTWLARGVPTAQARAAIALLQRASTRGLRAADYAVDAFDPAAPERFDRALTTALARYLHDLHEGRVPPEALGFHLPETHRAVDYVGLARAASTAPDVAAAVAQAEPPYAGYAALVATLARLQALAADTSLHAPMATARAVRPGDAFADAGTLRHLLVALGDLAAADTVAVREGPRYDTVLVRGVQAFQRRHGRVVDGIIGPATFGALRVPLAQRVRQVALTLERWRWLPDRAPERYVVVNVPAFRLYAFERDAAAARPVLRMDVIVGRAEGRTHTPVFTATMRQVVFQPYWDVPPSIARKELVPRLRRDPALADVEGYEIVALDAGDAGARTYAMTGGNLSRVADGALRLRQRPGERNALGPIKFVFPNPYNVYLHGTPARQLFAETRRDFSHGCVRVEDPASLATLVLRDQDGWDRAAIEEAMATPVTRRVPLARTWDVFMLYATVVVGDDGIVRFYPDVYGHDAALARALDAARDGDGVAAR